MAALGLAALLAVWGTAHGAGAAAAARVALGLGAIGGLAGWYVRGARRAGTFGLPPRLVVVSRAGLSARAGLALVEADGEAYLVVHGEGFARIHRTRRRARPRLVTDEVAQARALRRAPPSMDAAAGGVP